MQEKRRKLAVILPGIGYHKDKPLLYYAAKTAGALGYEVVFVTYHDMPQKIQGDSTMMKKAAELAYEQTAERLREIPFLEYTEVLFIGKSIGTVAMAKFVADNGLAARQIWYTPVEATFSFGSANAIAFIGDADPWSDVEKVKKLADELGIRLFSYSGCNHSLECADVGTNIKILDDVMKKTADYVEQ